MLEAVQRHFDHDRIKKACRKLNSIYRRCDSAPRPPDHIIGEAVPELSDMILDLMEIECE
jgi:hypothetical protein